VGDNRLSLDNMKYKLVYIEWEDSLGGTNHWKWESEIDYKEHERHAIHVSVGFLVNETKRSVFLSSEMMRLKLIGGEPGSLIDPGSIPKSAIRKRKVLKI